jgi:ATP-binding cassette subfamily F protein uup
MFHNDAAHLRAVRPDRPLFEDVSLTLSTGDRVGVVGINGCGKSTLLRMLARDLEPEQVPGRPPATVRWGRGVRVGVLGQRPVLAGATVREAAGGTWQGEAMLDRLGMGGLLDARCDELSGGQAKRVALASLLADEHDALVLDEPTNHLDLDAIAYLEQWLTEFRGGLVMVTHDRHVLDRVTTKVLEIDRGSAYVHVPEGWHAGSGYAAYLAGRAEREAQAEVAEQTRRTLARSELAWLRRGAPARTSKPKAHIARATAIVEARPQAAARDGELTLAMGSQRLGSKGVELREVTFGWPDGTPVLDATSVLLEPGDRIGIVGPNGAGKTTLLELIAGRLQPTSGAVERGATVAIGYYDQLGRDLDPAQRVREAVAGDKGEPSLADVALMRRFWFDGDAQFAPIGTLSGGERRRLQLLLTLVAQPNVLLLDEPTNDLDLDTLRALEDLLDDWPGIAVVVSHDRVFLDRTVSTLLAVEPPGRVREIRGGVGAWLAERAGAATAPAKPTSTASSGPAAARPSTPVDAARRPTAGRSPSTVRRQLGQAERAMAQATERRDQVAAALSTTTDHRELARLGEQLASAQADVDAAEEQWLTIAAEAEAVGLDLDG